VLANSLHGVALVDKPVGLSSFAVVAQIRRLFRGLGADTAGHTGTLDPMATGLLPICIGPATRYAQRMLDADKVYRASIQLGYSTTTYDAEGDIVQRASWSVEPAKLVEVLARFEGEIEQRPPEFCALKIAGEAAYMRARRGEKLELAPRRVCIRRLSLLGFDAERGLIELEVRCSKGTYIRSLAHDLAQALGTAGHLAALRRLQTGAYVIEQAHTLEQWEQTSEVERLKWLQSTESLLQDLPALDIEPEDVVRLRQGKRWPLSVADGLYRARSQQHGLLGLVRVRAGLVKAERLLGTC
jgi:tRNA pseudouridine 55 synthase